MDLHVTEKIGVYDIIYTNTIIVYKDQEIRLSLQDGDSNALPLIIKFVKEEGAKRAIRTKMEESILNIDFVNQDVNGNAMGLPEPIAIAKSEDGEAVYFNCVLHTYNAKDGYRLLYYSLYTLKD